MVRTMLYALLAICGLQTDVALAQEYTPFLLRPGFENVGQGEDKNEADEIETDRDSFTPATTLARRHRLIVESAYTFIDNRRVPETHSFPELLARCGVRDWLELRFGTNYEVGGAGNPVSAVVPDDFDGMPDIEAEANVSYGLKAELTKQREWVPQSAVLLQAFTPTSGENTDTHFVVTYVFGWQLPNKWTWDTAIRYSTGSEEEDHFNVWSPSTVIKIPVGESWKIHAEYFGIFSDGRDNESVQQFFSPGAHYLISQDFEVGVRVGWGLNDETPNFFANFGGGYRF